MQTRQVWVTSQFDKVKKRAGSLKNDWAVLGDDAGMVLSAVCAVHCLITPVVVAFFPAMFAGHTDNDFHFLMLGILSSIALFSLVRGVRLHGHKNALILGAVGIALLAGGIVAFEVTHDVLLGSVITTVGSGLLILAHYLNRRYCKCHSCRASHAFTAPASKGPPWPT